MSLSLLVGWILLGTVAVGALAYFWNDIKEWLNNTAADAVERALGYNARLNMQRAVSVADRIMQTVRVRSTIYAKKNPQAFYIDKVIVEGSIPESSLDNNVIQEIKNKGSIVQEFVYQS